jgi:hypothetical protein
VAKDFQLSAKGEAFLQDIIRRQSSTPNNITKQLAKQGEVEIVYNSDQLNAYSNIQDFLKSSNVYCSLIGAAGTGKTTLLKKVIEGISKVAISAPTHKAKLEAGIRSGVKTVYTVAELIGLNPDVDVADFDPHKPAFAQKREPKIKDHKVHVIDEGSMLNNPAKEKIVELAEEYGVQVIFVGDECQLPPVGEAESTALQGENVFQLHTIIRQSKTNPLTYVLAVLRYMQEIYINSFKDTKERFDELWELIIDYAPALDYNELYNNRKNMFFYIIGQIPSQIVDGKGFVVCNDTDTFYKKALKGVDEGGRLLAFTNKTVAECNMEIRKRKGYTKEFEIDEILTSYKTLRDDKNNMFFINSLDYKIIGKQPKINSYDFQVIRLELIDNYYMNRTFVDILHKDEYSKFMDKYFKVLEEARQRGSWARFFAFKDAHCITRYNNGGETLKSDLDYGYALTIHKSQGSTYKYVYVRVDDIFRYIDMNDNKSILFGLKLLYVALSRATDVAIIKY